MFAVDVDEEIEGGTLTLNDNTANLTRNLDGRYWVKWGGSDASGHIEVSFPDGETARCTIDYVTHGMIDIQEFVIKDRVCLSVYEG